jgi:ABC-type nitrate/sulfonate/bicarbonate transport system permease component
MSIKQANEGQAIATRIATHLTQNSKVIFIEAVVALVLVWAFASNVLGLAGLISSPSAVYAEIVELIRSGEAIGPLVATTRRTLYAFTLTALVGTGLGVLMGISNFWEQALQDYITIGMALPSLFAAVFSAMWFGFSDLTPTVASAIIVFPYLAQNVTSGVNDIDHELIDMSKSFNVSRARVIRRTVLPSILPEWMAGARYSLAISWKIVALTELLVAENGIGYEIQIAMSRLSLPLVLAWTIIFLSVMMIAEYGIFQQVEKRLFEWRQETSVGIR